jgi:hypothetical protein
MLHAACMLILYTPSFCLVPERIKAVAGAHANLELASLSAVFNMK